MQWNSFSVFNALRNQAIIRYSHNTTKRFGFNTFILCGAFQAVSLQLRRRLLAAQSASVCLLTPISIEFRSFANRINSKWIFTPRGLHTPSTFFYINFKNHIFFLFRFSHFILVVCSFFHSYGSHTQIGQLHIRIYWFMHAWFRALQNDSLLTSGHILRRRRRCRAIPFSLYTSTVASHGVRPGDAISI